MVNAENVDNVQVAGKEESQQLRQGLVNVDALDMLKSIHGDHQDVNDKYNDLNPVQQQINCIFHCIYTDDIGIIFSFLIINNLISF